jgi:hypothetical protein
MESSIIRMNEPWSEKSEKLLQGWKDICVNKENHHENQGRYYKLKHQLYGLPAILIPIIISPLVLILNISPTTAEIISTSSLISTGLFNGIHRFFGFQEKSFHHLEYGNKYAEQKTFIEVELAKEKEYRFSVDRFIEITQAKIDFLNQTEPN